MDPEDQKPKITLANFFESIKDTNVIVKRALKMSSGFSKAIKESSDLIEVNKSDIQELQRKVTTISQDITNIQDYIEDQQERRSRELDKREDEVFEKEDKLQKEFKGESDTKGAGGATSTADALGKGAGAFISSGLGFGLMGLNALMSPRSAGEIFGGIGDALSGNVTDFDKRGGETGGPGGVLAGMVDFFTLNKFDLDKKGGLFESKEKRPKKGLARLIPFNDGGKVFDNDGKSSNNNVDSVLAMLTPGEFVMKKEAVDRLGEGFLASLNESGDKKDKEVKEAVLKMLYEYEGVSEEAYDDGTGVMTIGFGATKINDPKTGELRDVRKGDKITKEQAFEMKDRDYQIHYDVVKKELESQGVDIRKVPTNVVAPLVSLAFNYGSLTKAHRGTSTKFDTDGDGEKDTSYPDSLPKMMAEAYKSNDYSKVADLLQFNLADDYKGTDLEKGMSERRFSESNIMRTGDGTGYYGLDNLNLKPDQPQKRSLKSKALGALDAITGNKFDFDNLGKGDGSKSSSIMPSSEDSNKDLSVNIAQNPSEGGGDNNVEILDTITQNMGGSSGDGTGSTIQPQFDLADTSSPAVMNPESPSEFIALLTDTSNSAFR